MPAVQNRPKPLLLLILDGWGHRDDPADNALAQARLPNWRRLLADCPHTLVHTEGKHVGLPDGQMGNSEVGHMNIGAGRIVYQDLTRVDAAIEDGSFFENTELVAACRAARAAGGTLHLFGLLSPGGVHSHEDHLFAMIELARREGVADIAVHAFLDGRDMPPRSAEPSLAALQAKCAELGVEMVEGPHCYSFFEGNTAFAAKAEEEFTAFYLTDFLTRQFDAFVWKPMGLDRHPELRNMYFGNYDRLIYQAQTNDPALDAKAREAADRLGLRYERRFTGYGDLTPALAKL